MTGRRQGASTTHVISSALITLHVWGDVHSVAAAHAQVTAPLQPEGSGWHA